ncbi:MAG: RHS repeat domain-containing protein, partial [Bacteroidota bacterium]
STSAHYYTFGMQMPGRSNSYGAGVEYRYAYNGMELDNKVSGQGNSYTTEFRQYDPRLARWKSLDPLMHQFPWMSPYVAFDDNPVLFVDPLGLASEDWTKDQAKQKADRMKDKGYENVEVVQSSDKEGNLTENYGVSTTGKKDGSGSGHYFDKPTNTASHSSSSASKQELSEIYNRGFSDAMYNANSFGVTDLFNVTDNEKDYGTKETRTTYLQGRLAGNTAAIVQGLAEVDAGGTAAAGGLATGPGAAVISTAGAVTAGHGSAVAAVATADQIETSLALARLNSMNGGSGSEGSTGLNSGGGKNGQHANQKAKQSALEKYESLKKEFESLRSKPNKSKSDNALLKKLEKQVKHLKQKADYGGENHSRTAKGNR